MFISQRKVIFLILLAIIAISVKAQDNVESSMSMINRGRDMASISRYDSAVFFFQKSIEGSIREKDERSKTIAQSELGRSWVYLESYKKANEISFSVLKNKKAATRAQIIAHHNLGEVYNRLSNDEDKEFYHNHKALEIANSHDLSNFDNASTNDSLRLSNKMLALEKLASMHRNRQAYDSAQYYLGQLMEISVNNLRDDNYYLAFYKTKFANTYINQRKLREAKKELFSTRPLIEQLPLIDQKSYNLASVFYDYLGVYYSLAGNIDSSLIAKQQQQYIMSISPRIDSVLLAKSQSYTGVDYYNLGDMNKALEYEQKAFALKKRILPPEHPDLAFSYKLLGLYKLRQTSGANEAVEYLEENLRINLNLYGKMDARTVDAYHNLSSALNAATRYDESLKMSQEALKIQKMIKGNDFMTGAIYTAIAFNLSELGRLEESIAIYNDMIDLLNNSEEDLSVLNVNSRTGLALIYEELGEYAKAEKYLREAADYCVRVYGPENYRLINIYLNISYLVKDQGRILDALEMSQKSIDLNSYNTNLFSGDALPLRLIAKSQSSLVKAYIHRSRLLLEKQSKHKGHDLSEFWQTFERSVDYFNSWTSEQANSLDIISLQTTNKTLYSVGIDALWLNDSLVNDREENLRMWQFSERSKAVNQKLNDQKRQVNYPLASTQQIRDEQQTADANISHYKSLTLNGNRHDSVRAGLFNALQMKKELEQRLKSEFPKDYSLTHLSNDIPHSTLKAFLGDNQTIIDYFIAEENLYAFVINENDIHSFRFDWSEELQNEVSGFKTLLISDSTNKFQSVSWNIYQKIFKPLEEKISGSNVIIVPDRSLWNLNFDLLLTKPANDQHVKNNYLIQKYAISYSYSTGLLLNNQKEKSKKQVLAFAYAENDLIDPKVKNMRDSPKGDLPGTARELRSLESSLDGEFYFGEDANEWRFKQSASGFAILHFALHGEVDDQDPDNSKLFFTGNGQSDEDNTLHTFELYNMSLNADLAVLSACNTGSGKINDGEGVMSLGKAFQYAGVNSVLLSQWEVSDATTPVIMSSFYKNLQEGKSKSESLRQAKLEFLESANNITENPYYWGSFFIIGNPKSIDLSSKNDSWYWVLGLLILITVIATRKKTMKNIKT